MGAVDFKTEGVGGSMTDAFANVKAAAQHENGHGGYTGTIAEKPSAQVVFASPLPRDKAYEQAQEMIDRDDDRIADKWGPAGAIRIEEPGPGETWLFFGWAST